MDMQSFQCMVRKEVSKTSKVVSWKLVGMYLQSLHNCFAVYKIINITPILFKATTVAQTILFWLLDMELITQLVWIIGW